MLVTSSSKRFGLVAQLALTILIAAAPLAASAYVGPGAGLSLMSALWGLLCAIGAAFLFIILWPIRRLRRRRREARGAQPTNASREGETAPQNQARSAQGKDADEPRA